MVEDHILVHLGAVRLGKSIGQVVAQGLGAQKDGLLDVTVLEGEVQAGAQKGKGWVAQAGEVHSEAQMVDLGILLEERRGVLGVAGAQYDLDLRGGLLSVSLLCEGLTGQPADLLFEGPEAEAPFAGQVADPPFEDHH